MACRMFKAVFIRTRSTANPCLLPLPGPPPWEYDSPNQLLMLSWVSPMKTKKERAEYIARRLNELYPEIPIPLDHTDA